MSPKLKRIVFTSIAALISLLLLFCNLGYNFKSDIFSYREITNHYDYMKAAYTESTSAEKYNNKVSSYISTKLKEYSISPILTEGSDPFLHTYTVNLPFENAKSYIELVSKYDNVIREYKLGEDFSVDVSGLYSQKYAYGNAVSSNSIEFQDYIPNILLLDNYKSLNTYSNNEIDSKLRALGVNALIYKESKDKISSNRIFYDQNYITTNNGIAKFAVNEDSYNEIKDFVSKGYKLRVKSGVKIKEQSISNIYGKIEGSNPLSKPLIITCFYDSEFPSKYNDKSYGEFEQSIVTSSMLLECFRVIKQQENITPDRTIIFAFLSGKNSNKTGLTELQNLNIDGDYAVLDNFGNSTKFNVSINESFKNFSNTINYFMNKNNFKVVSTSVDGYIKRNFAFITGTNNYSYKLDFSNSYNSCKLILSIIGDECFNLDALSTNSREIRTLKRFIKDYTIPISMVTLIFITFIVFRYPEIKNNN
ncbi:MAG: hypothetical protein RR539_06175 [Clostridium sp.]|uniref:hypothetical protein n=1 Tax=Clostridium sp. TaxID=1506 RepID=UPI002FCB94E7